ncbi:hypothetical protein GCM10009552_09520 [Rothia nasimurium]
MAQCPGLPPAAVTATGEDQRLRIPEIVTAEFLESGGHEMAARGMSSLGEWSVGDPAIQWGHAVAIKSGLSDRRSIPFVEILWQRIRDIHDPVAIEQVHRW